MAICFPCLFEDLHSVVARKRTTLMDIASAVGYTEKATDYELQPAEAWVGPPGKYGLSAKKYKEVGNNNYVFLNFLL